MKNLSSRSEPKKLYYLDEELFGVDNFSVNPSPAFLAALATARQVVESYAFRTTGVYESPVKTKLPDPLVHTPHHEVDQRTGEVYVNLYDD